MCCVESISLCTVLQALQHENIALRKRLTASRALCSVLRERLAELGSSVDELLCVDERGNLDVRQLSARRVQQLKQQLQDTHNMTSNLSVSLKRESPTISLTRSLSNRALSPSASSVSLLPSH